MELRRRPITSDEYHKMLEAGILDDGEPIELLRGDLVRKVTIRDRHRACVNRLNKLLASQLLDRAIVQVQNPVVVLNDSEPEPDIALLKDNDAATAGTRHAYPPDVFGLIEVTDSSRARDLKFKRQLYAEAGICEYWVVDLERDVIHVHRDPEQVTRRYRTTFLAHRSTDIAFEAFPNDVLSVDQILGPPTATASLE